MKNLKTDNLKNPYLFGEKMSLSECFECQKELKKEDVELHHVIPKLLGGTRVVPLCFECHDRCHDKKSNRKTSISMLTKNALSKLRKNKRALGNPNRCRYGYQVSSDKKSLVINQAEMKTLKYIWELRYDQGLTGKRITEILKLQGYTTRGGKPHHLSGIYAMLKSMANDPCFYPFLNKNRITRMKGTKKRK